MWTKQLVNRIENGVLRKMGTPFIILRAEYDEIRVWEEPAWGQVKNR